MNVAKGKKGVLKKLNKNIGKKMDELEKRIVENHDLIVCPLVHRFTDGLYSREMFLEKGCLITTKTHKVQHQFFLLSGSVLIFKVNGECEIASAPYIGITEVGTRRVIYSIDDCVWVTCHPNPENHITEEIEKIIFEEYSNDLLTDDMRNKIMEVQEISKKMSTTINTNLLKHK